jgi:UDP-N-acetylmuramoyl-tripeptide--D-alanyl-D-alanine ligase
MGHIMIQMTLSQAATLLGCKDTLPTNEFCGLSIDTRTLQPGHLFIAIAGEHFDGHDYLAEAQHKGAAGAIVSRLINNSALPQIQVSDPATALGHLSAAWRDRFTLPLLAVTGSNGKTTVKNMIASILSAACTDNNVAVLATQGTLNNHLGLPLTLMQLNNQHRYAVIEMGMNHFGEIAYLTKLTRPAVAIITNAAAAHLEGVHNMAGAAQAKAEIFLGLQAAGIAILNRDDAHFTYWHEQIGHHRYLTFGFHPDADIRVLSSTTTRAETILLHTPHGNLDIHLPLLGKHNILNMLAAVAATLAIGIDPQAIKAGIKNTSSAPGRLQLHTLNNGAKIIDDTYNANPFSLDAAVATLASFIGKKILVLGDMKELGHAAQSLHQAAGEKIRYAGIDYLFTYGELSTLTAQAFGHHSYHFNEQEKLISALKPLAQSHTTILVKGSRSMHMEKVVARLIAA